MSPNIGLILSNQLCFEMKKIYITPAILEEFFLDMEVRIMAQSVVAKDTEVESVGQEIEEHDTDNWGHAWE